ncbi:hypothetical protein AM587_10004461 [Phytophthora nicotianae]|uniref:Uncharacterized protein n=1 Tax=Phytophthora nicotianae TaxID=4792 RepID=A0A0W8CT83_PHYNI|nr:hypothetical protein AM587_10004461 [Phytophthora nicotianae]
MVVSVGSDAAATARSDENQDGANEQEIPVASSVETLFTTSMPLKRAQLTQNREIQLMELEVRKRQVSLQEKEMEVRQLQLQNETRATEAKIAEANAQTAKLLHESQHWRLQRKVSLLLERKKLLDEGVPIDDIDALLPLSSDL